MVPFDSSKMEAQTVERFIPTQPGDEKRPEIIVYYYYPELIDLLENQ